MWRRRIIRSFFLGLLLLCVGGWGWSYVEKDYLSYGGRHHWYGEILHGTAYVAWMEPPMSEGWFMARYTILEDAMDTRGYHCLGFAFWLAYDGWRFVGVPLWFPTFLSALALLLVWRKTKNPTPRGAFPVEMGA